MRILIIYFILLQTSFLLNGDMFTSTLKLCRLLHDELAFLEQLESYVELNPSDFFTVKLVQEIRKYIPKNVLPHPDQLESEECLDEKSPTSRFVSHPLNSYFLIYRFTTEWPQLVEHLERSTDSHITLAATHMPLPDKSEMRSVYEAFVRLTKFYELDPYEVATGVLSKVWANKTTLWTPVPMLLRVEDMFEIGKKAYDKDEPHQTQVWMDLAYRTMKNTSVTISSYANNKLLFDILDHLSWSEFTTGDYEKAYDHYKEMLVLDPQHQRTINNLDKFHEYKRTTKIVERFKHSTYLWTMLNNETMLAQLKAYLFDLKLQGNVDSEFEGALSEKLCKEGFLWEQDPSHLEDNYCRVVRGSLPNNRFIQAKVEKIFSQPDVYIFRGIASDAEIMALKQLAQPTLRTATVHNPVTGNLETSNYRITQSSWHNPDSHPVIRSITARLRVATGLSLISTEDLQIANYGIGGYYDSHFDYAAKHQPSYNDALSQSHGHRLATFLLYMCDVEVGGSTGFNRIGVSVQPSKGDSIFWYNLHPDLTGDARTRHIACPVVLGTKWVANYWIRSKGEENSRPCTLLPQDGI